MTPSTSVSAPAASTSSSTCKEPSLSFLEQLETVVSKHSKDTFATWYNIKGDATNEYTFQQLWDEAGLISYHLRKKWGLKKGQRVVLCYDFGLHFFAAFLGCLRAGVVAVLVYPPSPPLSKSLVKMTKVVQDCQPVLILTDLKVFAFKKSDELNPFSNSRQLWPSKIEYKVTDVLRRRQTSIFGRSSSSFDEPNICPTDLAFLQYTSGSTGEPKGVMVNHQALKANVALVHDGFEKYYARGGGVGRLEEGQRPCGFSWLPQYHDLGLIYASIAPFAGGWRMHMMSPLTFIQRPLLWLDLMSKHKVNLGVGPDFAYKLCVRKYQEAKARNKDIDPLPGLDLSCIHNLQCGTEPVRLDTASSFWNIFGPYGLREDYFSAGYGMAENVVGVCWCNGFHLSHRGEDIDRQPFVAIGHRGMLADGLGIIIVDPETNTQVEDEVTGEVWISGPSVAAGYHGKPELTEEVFHAKLQVDEEQGAASADNSTCHLRTGDLGFFQDDFLFICGRIKDLIIVNGSNVYPQDLEYSCQNASPAVRPGCVASFASNDSTEDGRVVVVFEIRKSHEQDATTICQIVKDSIAREAGITPWAIVAIAERTLPKTTSGKIRRRETRHQFHEGLLKKVHVLLESAEDDNDKAEESGRTGDSDGTETVNESAPHHPSVVDELAGLQDSEKYEKILLSVLGPNYNPLASWEDNGLTSMKTVELTSKLANAFPMEMPPDFSSKFPTPSALHTFVLNQSNCGSFFPSDTKDFGPMTSTWDKPLPLLLSTMIQGMGIVCLLLTLALSTAPAIYFARLCQQHASWMTAFLPLTVAVWHICFSLLVILSKWIVVGRYTTRKVAVPSVRFLEWWYVDRALHLWEFTTGNFLTGTPLLLLFYRLMGAALPSSVQLDAFLREFDLLDIGPSVSIQYPIHCRKFGHWEKTEAGGSNPTLRFGRITLQEGCTIRGHIGIGATVGQGSHVEKLAAVPEGAQVPPNVTAVGSPAFQGGDQPVANTTSRQYMLFSVLRVAWIVLELYLTAALVVLGELAFSGLFDLQWRYAALLHVTVLLAFTTIVGFLLCVPIKWILVGKRKPDVDNESELQDLFHWMADYHFHLYRSFFDLVGVNSVACNLLLRCLGLDIDFESKVWLYDFPPSKVDLISIQNSMIAGVNFDVKSPGGKTQRIQVENCTVGHTAVLSNGCHIQHTEVAPLTRVTSDIAGDGEKWAAAHKKLPSVIQKLPVDLSALPVLLGLAMSFIPTIEFYNAMSFLSDNHNSLLPHVHFSVIQLALTLSVHSLTWYLLCIVLHRVTYGPVFLLEADKTVLRPPSPSMYSLYLTLMFSFWELSLLTLLWGTPFMNLVVASLGAKIDGPLWYFGQKFYDAPMISTSGPTLVDTASLNGHSAVYMELEFGPCQLSGMLHEGTVCLANTHMKNGTEAGPVRYVNPSKQ